MRQAQISAKLQLKVQSEKVVIPSEAHAASAKWVKSRNLVKTALWLWVAAAGLFGCAVVEPAWAVVHINEILPNPEGNDNKEGEQEWVELYNDSEETVSLTGWKLVDNANRELGLDDLENIEGKRFKVYNVDTLGGWMNNSGGDRIVLLDKNGQQQGQEFAYGSDPGEGITLGRWPDGADGWVTMKSVTKGSANSGPEPTATPTPENTPTPTPEPTATPTPKPSPTKKPATPTWKENAQANGNGDTEIDGLRDQVLGEKSEDKVEEVEEKEQGKRKIDWLALGLIGGGGALLGGSGLVVWKSRRQKFDV